MKSNNSVALPMPVVTEVFTAQNPHSEVDVRKALHAYLALALPACGKLEVSMWLANIRLLLMFSACAGGLYAQFGCKFPRDSVWIALFAVLYFIQSGIVQLMDWFLIKKSAGVLVIGNRKVFLDAEAPTADNNVTFRFRSPDITVESRKSVGDFFYADGRLSQQAIWKEVNELHTLFLAQAKTVVNHPKKD